MEIHANSCSNIITMNVDNMYIYEPQVIINEVPEPELKIFTFDEETISLKSNSSEEDDLLSCDNGQKTVEKNPEDTHDTSAQPSLEQSTVLDSESTKSSELEVKFPISFTMLNESVTSESKSSTLKSTFVKLYQLLFESPLFTLMINKQSIFNSVWAELIKSKFVSTVLQCIVNDWCYLLLDSISHDSVMNKSSLYKELREKSAKTGTTKNHEDQSAFHVDAEKVSFFEYLQMKHSSTFTAMMLFLKIEEILKKNEQSLKLKHIDEDKEIKFSRNTKPKTKKTSHSRAHKKPSSEKFKTRKYKIYEPEALASAIEMVCDGMPVGDVATLFNIPSRTIYDRIKKLNIDKKKIGTMKKRKITNQPI